MPPKGWKSKKAKKSKFKRRARQRAKSSVDRFQNKRILALERANKEKAGWIDSVRTEATASRVPQIISSGAAEGQPSNVVFFANEAGNVSLTSDNDHTRGGLSIKALRISGHLTLTGRGSAAGYPPDTGSKTGKNNYRLLGVCYATQDDYALGISDVLQTSVATDSHPSKAIDSFYKKQKQGNNSVWLDEKGSVSYSTQTKMINFSYKLPEIKSKMVYSSNSQGAPITNIHVLYLMTGIRDNSTNQMTSSAVYRCTYVK